MSAPNETLRLIHFYNKDGFVHYTSSVVPGLREPPDCRVADVVRSLDDVCDRTVGILPSTVAPETLREVMSPTAMNLAFFEQNTPEALPPTLKEALLRVSPQEPCFVEVAVRHQLFSEYY